MDCPVCKGIGVFWDDPVTCRAGMSGQRAQREWAQFGLYESGDLVFTIPSDTPMYRIGESDRVTLLNNTDRFSVTLVRGANDIVQHAVVNIDRVFWLSDDSEIVDGSIPTYNPATGALSWSEGDEGQPSAGRTYAVNGTRYLEYYCFKDLTTDRNHHFGAALPRKVVLRRFDLWGRK